MQAPGGPEEDTSGDFKYGGWAPAQNSPADAWYWKKAVSGWANTRSLYVNRKYCYYDRSDYGQLQASRKSQDGYSWNLLRATE